MKKALFVAALTIMTTAASFAATAYTDEAAFLGAIGQDYYLEDFDAYGLGDCFQLYEEFAGGDWEYYIMADDWLFSTDGGMSTSLNTDPLYIEFTGAQVNAFGGYFYGGDYMGEFQDCTMTVSINGGEDYVFNPADTTDFRGFVSEDPISWITLDAVGGDYDAFSVLDHFYVGTVPEPAGLALLAVGALAALRRR